MRAVHRLLAASVPFALLSVACLASAADQAKPRSPEPAKSAHASPPSPSASHAASPTPKSAPTAARPVPTEIPSAPAPASSASASSSPPSNATSTSTPPSPAPRAAAATAKSGAVKALGADGKLRTCVEQSAQAFLVRGNWFPKTKDADELRQGRKLLEQAIRYRTEQYGYFEGFGNARWNKHPPRFYAKDTSFLGHNLRVHEKVIPALRCVEAALIASGASKEYEPRTMGGIRYKNTYRGVEVSNHVYGIAIDIEPDRNSCCGCVAPWPNHPLCKAKDKTVWERMAMPKSWVDVFERYGFYWLGHDVLMDTMHFEFLGDPDRIFEGEGTVAATP